MKPWRVARGSLIGQSLPISFTRSTTNLNDEQENYSWKDGETIGVESPKKKTT